MRAAERARARPPTEAAFAEDAALDVSVPKHDPKPTEVAPPDRIVSPRTIESPPDPESAAPPLVEDPKTAVTPRPAADATWLLMKVPAA